MSLCDRKNKSLLLFFPDLLEIKTRAVIMSNLKYMECLYFKSYFLKKEIDHLKC